MTEFQRLKQRLFEACVDNVEKNIATIQQTLASIEESRNNETKSSVGDKYETGRAMMQMEEEKSRAQLSQAAQLKSELSRIDLQKSYNKVEIGSLVQTNTGTYFIAIGMGKVKLDETTYFCISINSPIGQLLQNRSEGEEVIFNNKAMKINKID